MRMERCVNRLGDGFGVIRDDRYKLNIYWSKNQTHEYQLFDMQNDPNELTDLSTDPALKSVLEKLKLTLQDHVQGQYFVA